MVGSCPSPHWIVRNILSLYIIAKYCLRAELGQIVEKKLILPWFAIFPHGSRPLIWRLYPSVGYQNVPIIHGNNLGKDRIELQ